MTKQEVLDKLAAKMDANRQEVRDQLEFLAELPGHEVHYNNVDLLQRLSVTWKEGRALAEVAAELVGLVYPEPGTAQELLHRSEQAQTGLPS